MTDQNSAEDNPNHQNSVVERQVRPSELMEELGIKKDAYAGNIRRVKWLGQSDNRLTVEITLAAGSGGPTALPAPVPVPPPPPSVGPAGN